MSRKYPYSVNDNATIWRNGMPAFSWQCKDLLILVFNYTYFTIRDDDNMWH